eukprot:jgi/Tetstr1/460296/TSEL_005596.t1
MAYESERPRKARARAAAAAAAAASADAGGPRAGHGRRAVAGMPTPLPPAEPGGRAPRPATQLATAVSMADVLTTKVAWRGRMTEVAVLVSPESLHATEAAQPHRH